MMSRLGADRNLQKRTRSAVVAFALFGVLGSGGDSGPLTITEARAASGSHSVTGLLVAGRDVLRLCEVLLELFPRQCGECRSRSEASISPP